MRPQRRSQLSLVALALGSLAGCADDPLDSSTDDPAGDVTAADDATALTIGGGPGTFCNPVTDTTIVNAGLARFAPKGYIDPTTPTTLELYAVTTSGVSVRRFYGKSWHSWRSYGYNASLAPAPGPTSGVGSNGWDAALTVLPGAAGKRDLYFGMWNGSSGAVIRDAIDLAPTGAGTMTAISPTLGYMSAVTGAAPAGSENVFGSALPNSVLDTSFATLNLPAERIAGTTASTLTQTGTISPEQIVGPGGAVSLRKNPAVDTTESIYLYAGDMLSEQQDSNHNWKPFLSDVVTMKLGATSWTSLGAPKHDFHGVPTPGMVAAPPFAFGFYWGDPNAGGSAQLNVFATARDAGSYQYRLFGRGMNNGNLEADWTEYGIPPTVGVDESFALTTGMTWFDGARYASTLRENLFGLTAGGKLIEFFWDGGSWQWGQVIANTPDGGTFAALSSAVIDTATYKRLSLFVRSSRGTIYEYSYTIDNGVWNGWNWTNLSVIQPCFVYVF